MRYYRMGFIIPFLTQRGNSYKKVHMLRIRFSRVGKKNAPSFRLVLTPTESPPKGKFLEILGFYNPLTKEKNVMKERIAYWISQGARHSDTAHNFLIREGVIQGKKISVHAKSKKEEVVSQDKEVTKEEKKEEKPEVKG